jgi:Delta7-sterol 5-desaturase
MELLTEILKQISQNFITGLIFNEGIIALFYYIFWVKFKSKFQKLRIQLKQRSNNEQIKREIKNSLLVFLVGAINGTIVYYLSTKGYNKVYTNFSDHPLFSIFGFFILLIVDDAWFYWTHRILHHPKIYKLVHLEHHKSVDVNPFTSMSFNFIEPLLLSIYIIPLSFIFPLYVPMLALIQIYGLLNNIKSHLGYEFFPAWWNKSVGKLLTSSTYHNMHHSKFVGNYGLHFRYWDRVMGTEFNDYENEFDTIKSR